MHVPSPGKRSGCLALLFPLLLGGLSGCGSSTPEEPVLLGHLSSFAGVNRERGRQARRGVSLAVADAHKEGKTVAGRRVAVLQVDDHGNPEGTRAEAVRLIRINSVVGLLAPPDPGLVAPLISTAKEYEVAVVVPGEWVGPIDEGVVLLGVAPGDRGRALARYARESLKVHAPALLVDLHDRVAQAVAAAFQNAWGTKEGKLPEEGSFANDKDRSQVLQGLLGGQPDALVLATPVNQVGSLLAALKEAGVVVPVLYAGPDSGLASVKGQVPPGGTIHLATSYVPGKETEAGKAFAQRFQKRYHLPPDIHAVQAYDATRLLIDALARVQKPERALLLEELSRWKPFESLTGTVQWIDRHPRRPLFLVRYQDGEARVVQTIEPEKE
jgi:branched-chain amino acid transport system substrate-binding protein